MSRHKGVKNFTSDIVETLIPPAANSVKFHYDCILGIRVLRNGNFRGLWELVLLDDHGNRKKIVTDANSRGMIMTLVRTEIMKIVVGM